MARYRFSRYHRDNPHPDCAVVRSGVRAAFAALRKQGFEARMSFMCCRSCAGAAFANKLGDALESTKVVYFTTQDAEQLVESGSVYVAFSYGAGGELVAALREQGLHVEWDGTDMQRPCVMTPDAARRAAEAKAAA